MLPHVFFRGPAGVLSRCPIGDARTAAHTGSPVVVCRRNICQNITSYGLGRAVRNLVGLVAKNCKQQTRLQWRGCAPLGLLGPAPFATSQHASQDCYFIC